eukprot:TRINITY_DN335_c2_g1_i1.p1 TRINITY_DN335_c2_g1~~TRINITY_DN335_c2_g1_i1.p1  ORF type:complete len:681 (+),score=215.00 TRINITY_DN335_c2_g1_i1:50-2092(+)
MPEPAMQSGAAVPPRPAGPSWMSGDWWAQAAPAKRTPAAAADGEKEDLRHCSVGWAGRSAGADAGHRQGYGSCGSGKLPPMLAVIERRRAGEDEAEEDGHGFPTEPASLLPTGLPARGTGADDPPPHAQMSEGQRAGLRAAAARQQEASAAPVECCAPVMGCAPAPVAVGGDDDAGDDDDVDVVSWGDVVAMRGGQPDSDNEGAKGDPSDCDSTSPPSAGDDSDSSLPDIAPGCDRPENLSSSTDSGEVGSGDDAAAAGRVRRKRKTTRKKGVAARDEGSDSDGATDGKKRGRFPPRTKKPSHCFIAKSAVVRLCSDAKELLQHCLDFKDARRGVGEAVQWGAAGECLGQVGTVHCVYPSGAVAVVFAAQKTRLKLPPAALTLYCGPVRGPVDTTAEEAALAEEIIASLRSHRGHHVIEDFLPAELADEVCRDANQLCSEEDMMRQGGTGKGDGHRRDGSLRGDSIRWMPRQSLSGLDVSLPDSLQDLHARLHRLRKALSHSLSKPLTRTSIQLARYPGDGRGYVKHRDLKLGGGDGLDRRRVTCLYYCNKDWREGDGGELAVYPQTRNPQHCYQDGDSYEVKASKQKAAFAEQMTVKPRLNTLLVFQSHVYHEVLPDFAPRVAFTFWMYGTETLGLSYPGAKLDMDAGLGTPGPAPAIGEDLKVRAEAGVMINQSRDTR